MTNNSTRDISGAHQAQMGEHRGATISVGALIDIIGDAEIKAEVRNALESVGIEFVDLNIDRLDGDCPNSTSATGDVDAKFGSPTQGPIQVRAPPSKILRFPDVIARTGLSRTTIWRRVRAGTFPAPVQLGSNSIGWPEPAIIEWVESRPVVAYATGESAA